MVMQAPPDDGYKVPDPPQGIEQHGPWTLMWSGWHVLPTAGGGGYDLQWCAWWSAWRAGSRDAIVIPVRGEVQRVQEGGKIKMGGGIGALACHEDLARDAAAEKAATRARIVAVLDGLEKRCIDSTQGPA